MAGKAAETAKLDAGFTGKTEILEDEPMGEILVTWWQGSDFWADVAFWENQEHSERTEYLVFVTYEEMFPEFSEPLTEEQITTLLIQKAAQQRHDQGHKAA